MTTMTTSVSNTNKILALSIAPELYESIVTHAQLAGQTVEKFVTDRLSDSIEAWIDYCNAVSMLNNEEEEHFSLR